MFFLWLLGGGNIAISEDWYTLKLFKGAVRTPRIADHRSLAVRAWKGTRPQKEFGSFSRFPFSGDFYHWSYKYCIYTLGISIIYLGLVAPFRLGNATWKSTLETHQQIPTIVNYLICIYIYIILYTWNPNGAPCFCWKKRPCFGGFFSPNRFQMLPSIFSRGWPWKLPMMHSCWKRVVYPWACTLVQMFSRWWFKHFFMFTPTWERFPIWRAYFFQRGWNRQLVVFCIFFCFKEGSTRFSV